jgi:GntR family transcriptional regulator, transcriptional repressor for pyruvate dehydrogenase complex
VRLKLTTNRMVECGYRGTPSTCPQVTIVAPPIRRGWSAEVRSEPSAKRQVVRRVAPGAGRLKLGQQIADRLQHQILRGELTAESRLPAEAELADQLGVSRTAVRDAMRTLAARGLVTVRHGHGITVATPSDAAFAEAMILMLLRSNLTVGDLVSARAQIEIEIGSLAANRRTADDCQELSVRLDAFHTAVRAGQYQAAEEHHVNVHLALLAATHYPALDILLRPMHQVILLTSHPPRKGDPRFWEYEAHAGIFGALRSGNRKRLRDSLSAHYEAMDADEYQPQRAGLVRDTPAMRDLLEQMLHRGLPDVPLAQSSTADVEQDAGPVARASRRER